MRILVTGGAGFVGSALVRRLHDEGHYVVVLDDLSRGAVERLPQTETRLRLFPGDIRRKHDVDGAMFGCDAIFHLAYMQGTQTFYSRPRDVIDVALRGISNVLNAAEIQGHKQLILVSSSEVYQEPPEYPTDESVPLSVPDVTNPRYSYGGGKIASEIAALAYSDVLDRVVIARPHNIYGPDMGWEHVIPELAKRMLELPGYAPEDLAFPIQGTGQETRSFCYIDDCVDALMLLLTKGADRNVYHIGNPEEVSIERLVRAMAGQLGRRVHIVPSALPQGSPSRRCPAIGKMQALGFSPKVGLATGLASTLDWYSTHV